MREPTTISAGWRRTADNGNTAQRSRVRCGRVTADSDAGGRVTLQRVTVHGREYPMTCEQQTRPSHATRRRWLRLAAGSGAAAVLLSGHVPGAMAQPEAAGIVGSWRLTIPEGPGAPPATALGTFTADGGYVQSPSNAGESTGHGVWRH